MDHIIEPYNPDGTRCFDEQVTVLNDFEIWLGDQSDYLIDAIEIMDIDIFFEQVDKYVLEKLHKMRIIASDEYGNVYQRFSEENISALTKSLFVFLGINFSGSLNGLECNLIESIQYFSPSHERLGLCEPRDYDLYSELVSRVESMNFMPKAFVNEYFNAVATTIEYVKEALNIEDVADGSDDTDEYPPLPIAI